jgi:hypothetical protein
VSRLPALLVLLVPLLSAACGTDADTTPGTDAGTDPDTGVTMDAGADAAPLGPACVLDHEVTLPGHEGQFFGTPHPYCRTFIAGIENGALVVVGSDAAGVGDHDCLLNRAVSYHALWDDGACSWTERIPQCDVATAVTHTYDKAGSYSPSVFAEDDAGLRTRSDSIDVTVLAQGGDVYIAAKSPLVAGNAVSFQQIVGAYGNLPLTKLTVAYRLQRCDGTEPELERRDFALPTAAADSTRTVTSDIELTLPPGETKGRVVAVVNPDGTVPETCPDNGHGLNNAVAVQLEQCPIFQ